MKKCYTCKNELEESKFSSNKCRKDGLNSICKDCSKERSKQYYKENKEKHKQVVSNRCKEKRKEIKEIINEIKSIGCCVCKELEICCLDFHHTRDKIEDVSRMALTGWSLEKIEQEIAKCVVICSNCHRKLHAGLISINGDEA